MTADRDFKQLVRARMAQTGQNYTAARADLLVERTEHGRAAETEHRRVVARFLVDGTLRSMPTKRKSLAQVLLALVELFEPGRDYSESEVNELLAAVWHDHVSLRRELVDYGYLERSNGVYRLPQQPPHRHPQYAQELPQWEAFWLPEYLSRTDD